jgi:predicted dehydrogenase
MLGAVGSHLVDMLVYLTGKKVKSVSAVLGTNVKFHPDAVTKEPRPVTSDDYFTLQVKFEDGLLGTVTASAVRYVWMVD